MDEQIKRYIIGDTETTGLPPNKHACQVGLIEIDPITLDVMWEIESLIDPLHPIEPGAQAIHGISDAMVRCEPTMAEFIDRDLAGGLSGSITMICHNVSFDLSLLQPIGGIDRTICTLVEARQCIRGTKSHKLADLAEHFGFVPDVAHKALADCHTTRLLLIKLMEITGQTLDQLATPKKRVVHVQPWGIHKDKLLVDIPSGYLTWLLTLKDLEPNLRESVEKALALK
jgi:DNA polymerase-3 subunit epsilon